MVLFLEILSALYHVPQSIHSYICEQSGQLEWSCYWRRFLSLLRFFLLLFFCLVYKLFQGIFDRRMKQNYFLPYPYSLIYLLGAKALLKIWPPRVQNVIAFLYIHVLLSAIVFSPWLCARAWGALFRRVLFSLLIPALLKVNELSLLVC